MACLQAPPEAKASVKPCLYLLKWLQQGNQGEAIKLYVCKRKQLKHLGMQEHNTVGQRFTQLIAHLGISKNAFATSLEKTATVIQHLVEERNKPGFDLLCKVFEVYPNVSKDWLLQGTGPMLTTDAALFSTHETTSSAAQPVSAAELPVAAAAVASAAATLATAAINSAPIPEAVVKAEATAAPAAPEPAPAVVLGAMPASAVASPVEPAPAASQPTPAALVPPAVAAPAASEAGAWQTALYTQQMAHQLALAELRNQHLQDQQRLMQQMMDLMQRKLL